MTRRRGSVAFSLVQSEYNLSGLETNAAFQRDLSTAQQGYLRGLYIDANPRMVRNLLTGACPEIRCGAYQLKCTSEDLFAGTVEALYLMRCTFFHGELVPSKEAAACYEPAYQLVRKFLASI